jgi:hypothetical protein
LLLIIYDSRRKKEEYLGRNGTKPKPKPRMKAEETTG